MGTIMVMAMLMCLRISRQVFWDFSDLLGWWHSRTPSMDRKWTHGPFCRSVSQVTDRSSCPWIDAPKAQLQSRTTVDQHGPSFNPRSVGLTVDRSFTPSCMLSTLQVLTHTCATSSRDVGSGSQHPDHA
ncbi:hypothetical protein MTR67_028204 [Solanum verrucosum]|uniref:Secreted protein n=1 Tax=Solanum verrucosum TaxID=315347 RepID=A0AAF0RAY8_SOLVR|nr:hypothetical protein MTR67_028204 [Solanum verrucosum]